MEVTWKPFETAPIDGRRVLLGESKSGRVASDFYRHKDNIVEGETLGYNSPRIYNWHPDYWMDVPEFPK